ncbi:mitochondrial carrier protein [Rhizoctonia solani]|uniref:Mitochondrial carrier protein n=1 Tax=Rhizoctonia solani TaxID=456999 RepID=A0A8H8T0C3_9AGAM|nr:mitochondrial carrier protein [Rhizoctonia solani]QRW24279.1 mitochondrial carrier protein [Rhizoctonia solani]
MSSEKRGRIPFLSPQTASYFVAGGIAGAASRTVVSPLERLKIILQVQPTGPNSAYVGVWPSLAKMWREEGWRGMMAGNGINCLRIVPYSAVQFTTYEKLKKIIPTITPPILPTAIYLGRLLAGALAGITSVTTTYPLDLVRSRLSIASASIRIPTPAAAPTPPPAPAPAPMPTASAQVIGAQGRRTMSTLLQHPSPVPGHPPARRQPVPSMWGMTLKVMREEGGIRGLYRGLIPTAVGVAPYVGINFAAYERLRQIMTPDPTVVGMQSGVLGYKYNGAIDALQTIVRVEGMQGLYRGLWPNLLKVAPSIATSFFTYETVKDFLNKS